MSDEIEMIDNDPISLRTPIEDDGTKITEVQVEEVSIEQIENRSKVKDDFKKSIFMMSDATGLSPAAVRQLKTYDFNRIMKRVGELSGTEGGKDED